MSIEFAAETGFLRSWRIEVIEDGAPIGNIRREHNDYAYFRQQELFGPIKTAPDLHTLKRAIIANPVHFR